MADSTIHTSRYNNKPFEFSGYIQDKIEFDELIVNAGVRFDYFDPKGRVLSDPSDPSIYNPIRPENRYQDLNENGIQDNGEPIVTNADREEYWYEDTEAKWKISPRLGVSFPITERGVVHFSYGHFFQIPRFELLYENPDFDLDQGTGNVGVIGNADLRPEKTVSGEINSDEFFMAFKCDFRKIIEIKTSYIRCVISGFWGSDIIFNKIANHEDCIVFVTMV